jgi:hypothetical protein
MHIVGAYITGWIHYGPERASDSEPEPGSARSGIGAGAPDQPGGSGGRGQYIGNHTQVIKPLINCRVTDRSRDILDLMLENNSRLQSEATYHSSSVLFCNLPRYV